MCRRSFAPRSVLRLLTGAVVLVLLLVASTVPAAAQGPSSHPDPMDAVRLFDASRSHAHASNIAFECPSASEWRRVAIHGILDLDISTPQDIATVAGALNGVLRNCDDARIRAWYHEKLRGLTAAEHRSAASRIASALMFAAQPDFLPDGTLAVVQQLKENPPAPEDLEVMLEVATDPARDDVLRQAIMGELTWLRHHDIRADIYVRTYRLGVPPRTYSGTELTQLFRGPERDRVALELARLLRDDPNIDPTGGLPRMLTGAGIRGLGPPDETPVPGRLPPSTARQVLQELIVVFDRLDTLAAGPVRDAFARAGPQMREALGRPPGG